MTSDTTVQACPCGQDHDLSDAFRSSLIEANAKSGPVVTFCTGRGSFLVPRIYVFCHNPKVAEIPEAAARYGFEQAT